MSESNFECIFSYFIFKGKYILNGSNKFLLVLNVLNKSKIKRIFLECFIFIIELKNEFFCPLDL